MRITKCDLCKKSIKDDQPVTAGLGYFSSTSAELCQKCGAPILDFLKKHRIIEEKKEKIIKSHTN